MSDKFFISAIVQARIGSTRFPGKVISDINGKSMLEILVERLKLCRQLDEIIIATTNDEEDNVIIELCEKLNLKVIRGSKQDVLSRYVNALSSSECDSIVRITADCPLIDPVVIDKVIDAFKQDSFDYVSNINPPTYPDGMDVEIFTRSALLLANKECILLNQREHVTPWIRENKQFRKKNIENSINLSQMRLTVDYEEDLELIKSILRYFDYRIDISIDEIIKLKEIKPELFLVNKSFKRNEGSNKNDGQKLWGRAKKVIPGGNMLLSKRAELFLPEVWPTYFSKSKGCKVWDLNNIEYLDMSLMSVGTNILGYSNQEVDKEIKKVINLGNMSTLNCPEEVFLAEKLIKMHPWADMVRFARTGGEANAISVRIARAATGRDKIAICGYHGWHDWYLATNLKSDTKLDEHLLPGLEPNGVPNSLQGTVISFSYNDLDQIKKIVEENDLAAIKMEVERNSPPNEGYLEGIRELCDKKGIVLIFDECTSGFRETFGGLHLKYKINPDIAIFGKALGNGYAITSVIGKSHVMEAAQKTFISSTFWTERIGPSAALKTLEIMKREESWKKITTLGKYLRKGWLEIAEKNNLKIKIMGIPALSSFKFCSKFNLEYKTLITQEMLSYGYLASNTCYLSLAHDTKIIDSYLNRMNTIFKKIKQCEENQNVKEYLNSPVCHSGFKRLN